MRVAFVFPGQGSYRPGVLTAWEGQRVSTVLDEVADHTGRDPRQLDRDPGTARRTADAQPAILAASLVAWRALEEVGITPDVVAGHSLGEATAAIAAGSLTVADGTAFVAARGRAMGEACAAVPGGMAALVKLSPDAVEVLLGEDPDLVVANDNSVGQVVVAGTPEAIERLRARAREAGGRALPLDVEGAFHSPAMASAVPPVADALARLVVRDPAMPLVSGTVAEPLASGPEVERALVDGILAPVRWREVQLRLLELGVQELVEVGPGGVLAGLARRTSTELRVHSVSSPDEVDALARSYAGSR